MWLQLECLVPAAAELRGIEIKINGTFMDEDRNYGNVSGITIIRVGDINYDANSDGRIDRIEALQAVVDFFNGIITKMDALNVVQAYFGG